MAALAALRDMDKQQQHIDRLGCTEAAASTEATPPDIQACIAEMFDKLATRLDAIGSSGSSKSFGSKLGRAKHAHQPLDRPLSPAGSSSMLDMTVQIASAPSAGPDSSDGAAGGSQCFSPPAAVVLVSPAMDTSERACFHDEEWTAAHEPR